MTYIIIVNDKSRGMADYQEPIVEAQTDKAKAFVDAGYTFSFDIENSNVGVATIVDNGNDAFVFKTTPNKLADWLREPEHTRATEELTSTIGAVFYRLIEVAYPAWEEAGKPSAGNGWTGASDDMPQEGETDIPPAVAALMAALGLNPADVEVVPMSSDDSDLSELAQALVGGDAESENGDDDDVAADDEDENEDDDDEDGDEDVTAEDRGTDTQLRA